MNGLELDEFILQTNELALTDEFVLQSDEFAILTDILSFQMNERIGF